MWDFLVRSAAEQLSYKNKYQVGNDDLDRGFRVFSALLFIDEDAGNPSMISQVKTKTKAHDGHRLHRGKREFIVARNLDLDHRVLCLVIVRVAAEKVDRVVTARHSRMVGIACLLYTSPSPRDGLLSRMPSSA